MGKLYMSPGPSDYLEFSPSAQAMPSLRTRKLTTTTTTTNVTSNSFFGSYSHGSHTGASLLCRVHNLISSHTSSINGLLNWSSKGLKYGTM